MSRSRLHGGLTSLFLCSAVVSAASVGEAAPGDRIPQRVMSLNLCTDQLLLALLPPERITSVTYIARFDSNPELRARAAAVGVNYATAEEVLAQRPDLVVTGDFSTPATRAVLKRFGYPILELSSNDTFDEIREQTLSVGRVVGAEKRAKALVSEMDAALAELMRTMPEKKITVVAWDGGSSIVPGKATLFNDILTVAGGINLAAGESRTVLSSFDIEQLLRVRPELIAYGEGDLDHPALSSEPLRHPLIQRLYANRQITYPQNLYGCGIPQSAMAAKMLRQTMQRAIARADGAR